MLVDVIVLSLFIYWFTFADRHVVFLYGYDMGRQVPDASPFSEVTSSRYWMAGLVAAGAIMILYATANWLLGRRAPRFDAPEWWRVWLLCVPLLLFGIPLITMTANQPTLPLKYAAQTTAAALIALALALSPGRMAANRSVDLIWLASDGFGLMMILLALPGFGYLRQWLERGQTGYIVMMLAGFGGGLAWLIMMTFLRSVRRRSSPTVGELLLAGFAVSYLLMPLFHHIFFTDGYFYITDSDNFFDRNMVVQAFVWLVGFTVALVITRLRNHLSGARLRPGARIG